MRIMDDTIKDNNEKGLLLKLEIDLIYIGRFLIWKYNLKCCSEC